jgi:hypothetical protein
MRNESREHWSRKCIEKGGMLIGTLRVLCMFVCSHLVYWYTFCLRTIFAYYFGAVTETCDLVLPA